nr:uncharacterized protein CFP56_21014 [Quercus suber]
MFLLPPGKRVARVIRCYFFTSLLWMAACLRSRVASTLILEAYYRLILEAKVEFRATSPQGHMIGLQPNVYWVEPWHHAWMGDSLPTSYVPDQLLPSSRPPSILASTALNPVKLARRLRLTYFYPPSSNPPPSLHVSPPATPTDNTATLASSPALIQRSALSFAEGVRTSPPNRSSPNSTLTAGSAEDPLCVQSAERKMTIAGDQRRRRRSSSLMYQEPPESLEQQSDQNALPNLNAQWVNAKGAWMIHPVLILLLKILYDIIPSLSQETSWTLVNTTYMAGSYLMFHYVRGVPFEFNAGAYDNLNICCGGPEITGAAPHALCHFQPRARTDLNCDAHPRIRKRAAFWRGYGMVCSNPRSFYRHGCLGLHGHKRWRKGKQRFCTMHEKLKGSAGENGVFLLGGDRSHQLTHTPYTGLDHEKIPHLLLPPASIRVRILYYSAAYKLE